eukprot:1146540-Pelagomonas_calceolata.AAC.2
MWLHMVARLGLWRVTGSSAVLAGVVPALGCTVLDVLVFWMVRHRMFLCSGWCDTGCSGVLDGCSGVLDSASQDVLVFWMVYSGWYVTGCSGVLDGASQDVLVFWMVCSGWCVTGCSGVPQDQLSRQVLSSIAPCSLLSDYSIQPPLFSLSSDLPQSFDQ